MTDENRPKLQLFIDYGMRRLSEELLGMLVTVDIKQVRDLLVDIMRRTEYVEQEFKKKTEML